MNAKAERPKKANQSPIRSLTERAAIHTAYFYYMKYAADGTYSLIAYEYFDIKQPLGNLAAVAEKLARNARNPNGKDPRPYGTDFDALFRRRRGYFIVALEGAAFNTSDPIEFYCDGATYPNSKGKNGKHTFVSLGQFNITIDGVVISFAAYSYRARSYEKGVELGHSEWEHFSIKFDAVLRARVVRALFDDSGGTNMGPPPPPPLVPPAP